MDRKLASVEELELLATFYLMAMFDLYAKTRALHVHDFQINVSSLYIVTNLSQHKPHLRIQSIARAASAVDTNDWFNDVEWNEFLEPIFDRIAIHDTYLTAHYPDHEFISTDYQISREHYQELRALLKQYHAHVTANFTVSGIVTGLSFYLCSKHFPAHYVAKHIEMERHGLYIWSVKRT